MDDLVNSPSTKVLSIIPATLNNSLFVYRPTTINQTLIDLARDYYKKYMASNNILGKAYFYTINGYIVTLYFASYKSDANGIPVLSSTPNHDIHQDWLRRFDIIYLQFVSSSTTTYEICNMTENIYTIPEPNMFVFRDFYISKGITPNPITFADTSVGQEQLLINNINTITYDVNTPNSTDVIISIDTLNKLLPSFKFAYNAYTSNSNATNLSNLQNLYNGSVNSFYYFTYTNILYLDYPFVYPGLSLLIKPFYDSKGNKWVTDTKFMPITKNRYNFITKSQLIPSYSDKKNTWLPYANAISNALYNLMVGLPIKTISYTTQNTIYQSAPTNNALPLPQQTRTYLDVTYQYNILDIDTNTSYTIAQPTLVYSSSSSSFQPFLDSIRSNYNANNSNQLTVFQKYSNNSDLSITFGAELMVYNTDNTYNIFQSRVYVLGNLAYFTAYFIQNTSNIYLTYYTQTNQSGIIGSNLTDMNPLPSLTKEQILNILPMKYYKFQCLRPPMNSNNIYGNTYDTKYSLSNINFYLNGNIKLSIPSGSSQSFDTTLSLTHTTTNHFYATTSVYYGSIYDSLIVTQTPIPTIANGFSFNTGTANQAPVSWILSGSPDNTHWITLHTQSNFTNSNYPSDNYQTPIFSFLAASNIPLPQASNYKSISSYLPVVSNDIVPIFSKFPYILSPIKYLLNSLDSYFIGNINNTITYKATITSNNISNNLPNTYTGILQVPYDTTAGKIKMGYPQLLTYNASNDSYFTPMSNFTFYKYEEIVAAICLNILITPNLLNSVYNMFPHNGTYLTSINSYYITYSSVGDPTNDKITFRITTNPVQYNALSLILNVNECSVDYTSGNFFNDTLVPTPPVNTSNIPLNYNKAQLLATCGMDDIYYSNLLTIDFTLLSIFPNYGIPTYVDGIQYYESDFRNYGAPPSKSAILYSKYNSITFTASYIVNYRYSYYILGNTQSDWSFSQNIYRIEGTSVINISLSNFIIDQSNCTNNNYIDGFNGDVLSLLYNSSYVVNSNINIASYASANGYTSNWFAKNLSNCGISATIDLFINSISVQRNYFKDLGVRFEQQYEIMSNNLYYLTNNVSNYSYIVSLSLITINSNISAGPLSNINLKYTISVDTLNIFDCTTNYTVTYNGSNTNPIPTTYTQYSYSDGNTQIALNSDELAENNCVIDHYPFIQAIQTQPILNINTLIGSSTLGQIHQSDIYIDAQTDLINYDYYVQLSYGLSNSIAHIQIQVTDIDPNCVPTYTINYLGISTIPTTAINAINYVASYLGYTFPIVTDSLFLNSLSNYTNYNNDLGYAVNSVKSGDFYSKNITGLDGTYDYIVNLDSTTDPISITLQYTIQITDLTPISIPIYTWDMIKQETFDFISTVTTTWEPPPILEYIIYPPYGRVTRGYNYNYSEGYGIGQQIINTPTIEQTFKGQGNPTSNYTNVLLLNLYNSNVNMLNQVYHNYGWNNIWMVYLDINDSRTINLKYNLSVYQPFIQLVLGYNYSNDLGIPPISLSNIFIQNSNTQKDKFITYYINYSNTFAKYQIRLEDITTNSIGVNIDFNWYNHAYVGTPTNPWMAPPPVGGYIGTGPYNTKIIVNGTNNNLLYNYNLISTSNNLPPNYTNVATPYMNSHCIDTITNPNQIIIQNFITSNFMSYFTNTNIIIQPTSLSDIWNNGNSWIIQLYISDTVSPYQSHQSNIQFSNVLTQIAVDCQFPQFSIVYIGTATDLTNYTNMYDSFLLNNTVADITQVIPTIFNQRNIFNDIANVQESYDFKVTSDNLYYKLDTRASFSFRLNLVLSNANSNISLKLEYTSRIQNFIFREALGMYVPTMTPLQFIGITTLNLYAYTPYNGILPIITSCSNVHTDILATINTYPRQTELNTFFTTTGITVNSNLQIQINSNFNAKVNVQPQPYGIYSINGTSSYYLKNVYKTTSNLELDYIVQLNFDGLAQFYPRGLNTLYYTYESDSVYITGHYDTSPSPDGKTSDPDINIYEGRAFIIILTAPYVSGDVDNNPYTKLYFQPSLPSLNYYSYSETGYQIRGVYSGNVIATINVSDLTTDDGIYYWYELPPTTEYYFSIVAYYDSTHINSTPAFYWSIKQHPPAEISQVFFMNNITNMITLASNASTYAYTMDTMILSDIQTINNYISIQSNYITNFNSNLNIYNTTPSQYYLKPLHTLAIQSGTDYYYALRNMQDILYRIKYPYNNIYTIGFQYSANVTISNCIPTISSTFIGIVNPNLTIPLFVSDDIAVYATTNGYVLDTNPIEPFVNKKRKLLEIPEIPEIPEDRIYKVKYVTFESSAPFKATLQLYDAQGSLPVKITKKDESYIVELEALTEVIGYSFITGEDYYPESLIVRGTNGKEWITMDKRRFTKVPPSYQMPLYYFNGTKKILPQKEAKAKEAKVKEKAKVKEAKQIDRNILKKYYTQKINPSIIPDFKKKMYDSNNDVYYFLYDEYDLNKNIKSKDLVIGFVMHGDKVKKAILYEDDEGNMSGFDLKNKNHKRYWDSKIMVALLF